MAADVAQCLLKLSLPSIFMICVILLDTEEMSGHWQRYWHIARRIVETTWTNRTRDDVCRACVGFAFANYSQGVALMFRLPSEFTLPTY